MFTYTSSKVALSHVTTIIQQDGSTSRAVRAIIGSVTDKDTIFLSTLSQKDHMPIMGYVAESSELSDKV